MLKEPTRTNATCNKPHKEGDVVSKTVKEPRPDVRVCGGDDKSQQRQRLFERRNSGDGFAHLCTLVEGYILKQGFG